MLSTKVWWLRSAHGSMTFQVTCRLAALSNPCLWLRPRCPSRGLSCQATRTECVRSLQMRRAFGQECNLNKDAHGEDGETMGLIRPRDPEADSRHRYPRTASNPALWGDGTFRSAEFYLRVAQYPSDCVPMITSFLSCRGLFPAP